MSIKLNYQENGNHAAVESSDFVSIPKYTSPLRPLSLSQFLSLRNRIIGHRAEEIPKNDTVKMIDKLLNSRVLPDKKDAGARIAIDRIFELDGSATDKDRLYALSNGLKALRTQLEL